VSGEEIVTLPDPALSGRNRVFGRPPVIDENLLDQTATSLNIAGE
jgi:hypothetical protein